MPRPFPREDSGRRRAPTRRSARTVLVVCGSKETERQYLQGLCEHLRKGDFDEVWCVFDVDQFVDVAEAAVAARRAGIRVAVSNPCFELWLLLHFASQTAHVSTYKKLLPLLRKHVPGYDKTRVDFVLYRDGRADAVKRARALDPTGEEHTQNPSTGVWRLVERMEEHRQ